MGLVLGWCCFGFVLVLGLVCCWLCWVGFEFVFCCFVVGLGFVLCWCWLWVADVLVLKLCWVGFVCVV